MRALLAIALALWATSASAEYTIRGEGASSCGQWLVSRRKRDALQLKAWVLGYLTRANYHEDRTVKIDNAGLFASIDNYCRAHPGDYVEDASRH